MPADFQRQLDMMPPQLLTHPVTIIGLGGIGSWTARIARKMGFRKFILWDHDRLEPHNLPSQDYEDVDLGELKVDGIHRRLLHTLDDKEMTTIRQTKKFTDEDEFDEGIVISAVDKMQSRADIWEAVKKRKAFIPLFVDGRIGIEWNDELGKVGGEWMEIFTIIPARLEDREFYEENLFSDDEIAPAHCTAQAVAYIGPIIAGFIVSNIKMWLMKEPYRRHLLYDNLTKQFMDVTN